MRFTVCCNTVTPDSLYTLLITISFPAAKASAQLALSTAVGHLRQCIQGRLSVPHQSLRYICRPPHPFLLKAKMLKRCG